LATTQVQTVLMEKSHCQSSRLALILSLEAQIQLEYSDNI